MAMLRPKHVFPLYNGARVALFAGSNHAQRPHPADSNSGWAPDGSAGGMNAGDSNSEQQYLPPQFSRSVISSSPKESISLAKTIESVIGPKTASKIQIPSSGSSEASILPENSKSVVTSHPECNKLVSSAANSVSILDNANLPSVSEQIFKQGTVFSNGLPGASPTGAWSRDAGMAGYRSTGYGLSLLVAANASHGVLNPPLASTPESILLAKQAPLDVSLSSPTSTRELMLPLANAYKLGANCSNQEANELFKTSSPNLHNGAIPPSKFAAQPIHEDTVGSSMKYSSGSVLQSGSESRGKSSLLFSSLNAKTSGAMDPHLTIDSDLLLPSRQHNHQQNLSQDQSLYWNRAQTQSHFYTQSVAGQQQNVSSDLDYGTFYPNQDGFSQEHNVFYGHQYSTLSQNQRQQQAVIHPYSQAWDSSNVQNQKSYGNRSPFVQIRLNQKDLNQQYSRNSFLENYLQQRQYLEGDIAVINPLTREISENVNNNSGLVSNCHDSGLSRSNPGLYTTLPIQAFSYEASLLREQNRLQNLDLSRNQFDAYPVDSSPGGFSRSRESLKNRTGHQSSSKGGTGSLNSPFHSSRSNRKSKNQNETVKAVCQALQQLRSRAEKSVSGEERGGNPRCDKSSSNLSSKPDSSLSLGSGRNFASCVYSQIDEALSRWYGSLNVYNACDVLKQQEDPDIAMAFFDWTKRQPGYRPDIFVYTTLIGILGKAKMCEDVEILLEEMKREGCYPTVVTYNRLIHSYGRANLLPEALTSFRRMIASGLKPDFVTYSSLIDIYSKAGFYKKALEVYDEMKKFGMKPDVIVYTMILNSFGKMGDLPKALSTFREIKDRGFRPNLVAYNTIIDLFGKSGNADVAMKLFAELKDVGLKPDLLTYSTVIDMCGKNGRLDEAEGLFDEMLSAGLAGDSIAWSTVIQMWGRAGNVSKAVLWFERMIDAGCTPTVPALNSLLSTFVKAGLFSHAKTVLEVMRNRGQKASLMTYTLLLSSVSECDSLESMSSILDLMKAADHPVHELLKFLVLPEEDVIRSSGESLSEPRMKGTEGLGADSFPDYDEFGFVASTVDADSDSSQSTDSSRGKLSVENNVTVQSSARDIESSGGGNPSSDREDGKTQRGSEGVWSEAIKKYLNNLRTEDLETKRAYSDAVIHFLFKLGKHGTAARMWKESYDRNFWIMAKEARKANAFTLDLHSMSSGTALVVVKSEFSALRKLAFEVEKNTGGHFPDAVEIITGWGRRSKVTGSCSVKREVEDFLDQLNSPFLDCLTNVGLIYASGNLVMDWLKTPAVGKSLVLKDDNCDGTSM